MLVEKEKPKRVYKKHTRIGGRIDYEKRADEIVKYLRKNPGKKYSVSKLHEEALGKMTDGDGCKKIKDILKNKSYYKIKIQDNPNNFKLWCVDKKKGVMNRFNKFISDNSAKYKRMYPNLNQTERVKLMSKEYQKDKYMLRHTPKEVKEYRQPLATFESTFPKIDNANQKILEMVFRRVIEDHGTFKYMDAQACGITENYPAFIISLAMKLNEICKYFNVPNKFVIEGSGKQMVVRYKK